MSSPPPYPSFFQEGSPRHASGGHALFFRPRLFFVTAAWALLLLLSASPARAKEQERVLQLNSDIQINADTSLSIREVITIYATGGKLKRGIIREFPAWFTDDLNYKIQVRYLDFEVKRNGHKEPFSFRHKGDTYRLFVGQASSKLTPGEHRYEISYTVLRRLQYFDTYDLLLWNVTGSNWGMPVEALEATVSLPKLTRPIQRYSAHLNGQGSKGIDFDVTFPEKGRVKFTLLHPLKPDEDFSIAVAWSKGLVREPTALQYYDNN